MKKKRDENQIKNRAIKYMRSEKKAVSVLLGVLFFSRKRQKDIGRKTEHQWGKKDETFLHFFK